MAEVVFPMSPSDVSRCSTFSTLSSFRVSLFRVGTGLLPDTPSVCSLLERWQHHEPCLSFKDWLGWDDLCYKLLNRVPVEGVFNRDQSGRHGGAVVSGRPQKLLPRGLFWEAIGEAGYVSRGAECDGACLSGC